jgi:UDP-N-acetylmuramoyl-tripeptide--D-alanyl-D-alanine ligase
MVMTTLSDVAAMFGCPFSGPDAEVLRVATDSRSIRPGDLFVALRGARFDGGRFAEAALRAGAVGAVLDATQAPALAGALRVDDTRRALGRLAAAWRERFTLPVVAITGSNGKTTVKEMLAAILRAHTGDEGAVLATEGNLNNDIGVPLMLLRLRPAHRFAVLEMGMNHAGEIDDLTRLARPTLALVNNAMRAHLGLLGSIEAIARAKGEIFNGLGAQGVALFNADDPHAGLWRDMNRNRTAIGFGLGEAADVRGVYQPDDAGGWLAVTAGSTRIDVQLRVAGEHNARNALAAAAAALALGVAAPHIAAGLAGFAGVKGRFAYVPGIAGSTFIDDTYNANPDSVRAALAILARRPGRKILVLGDMGELGDAAPALHAEIGAAARSAGVERLFALGPLTREAVAAFGTGASHYERIEELLADLENTLAPDTTVLVKGSRAMQMERVVQSFREGDA